MCVGELPLSVPPNAVNPTLVLKPASLLSSLLSPPTYPTPSSSSPLPLSPPLTLFLPSSPTFPQVVSLMSHKYVYKDVYVAAAEVLRMVLAYLKEDKRGHSLGMRSPALHGYS